MPSTSIVVLDTGPVVLSLLVGVVACWLLFLGYRRDLTWPRTVTVLLTSVYGAGVVVVTALPPRLALQPGIHLDALTTLVNAVPLVTIDPRTFLLNVVMTVPLGLLLPLLVGVRSVSGAALVGLLISAGIESFQGLANLLFDLGRTVDVNDLVANTTGTVLGLLCLRFLAANNRPTLTRFALPGSAVASPIDPCTCQFKGLRQLRWLAGLTERLPVAEREHDSRDQIVATVRAAPVGYLLVAWRSMSSAISSGRSSGR